MREPLRAFTVSPGCGSAPHAHALPISRSRRGADASQSRSNHAPRLRSARENRALLAASVATHAANTAATHRAASIGANGDAYRPSIEGGPCQSVALTPGNSVTRYIGKVAPLPQLTTRLLKPSLMKETERQNALYMLLLKAVDNGRKETAKPKVATFRGRVRAYDPAELSISSSGGSLRSENHNIAPITGTRFSIHVIRLQSRKLTTHQHADTNRVGGSGSRKPLRLV